MLRTMLITLAVLAVGYFLGSKYPGLLAKVGL